MANLSPSIHFNLYASLYLKWGFCRLHVVGSDRLCVVMAVFWPLYLPHLLLCPAHGLWSLFLFSLLFFFRLVWFSLSVLHDSSFPLSTAYISFTSFLLVSVTALEFAAGLHLFRVYFQIALCRLLGGASPLPPPPLVQGCPPLRLSVSRNHWSHCCCYSFERTAIC